MTDGPRTIQPDERGVWADAVSAIPEERIGEQDRARIVDSIRDSGVITPGDEALIRRVFVRMATPPSGPLAQLFRTAERIAPPDVKATDRNITVLQKIFGEEAGIQFYGILDSVPIYIVEAEGLRWEVDFYSGRPRFLAEVVDKKRIRSENEENFLKYLAGTLRRRINENIGDFDALSVTFAFRRIEISFTRNSRSAKFLWKDLELKSGVTPVTVREVALDENSGVNEPMIDDFVASIEIQPGQAHRAMIGGGIVLEYKPVRQVRRVDFIMQETVASDSSLPPSPRLRRAGVARIDEIRARLNEVTLAFEAVKARLEGRKFGENVELNLIPTIPASFVDDIERLHDANVDELDAMREQAYAALEDLKVKGELTLENYSRITDPVREKAIQAKKMLENVRGMDYAAGFSDALSRISDIDHDFGKDNRAIISYTRIWAEMIQGGEEIDDFSVLRVHKDLGEVLRSLYDTNRTLTQANKVKVEVDIPEDLQALHTQDTQTRRALQRILDNLINNAIKYHNPDVPEGERYVKVSVLKGTNTLLFLVKDNGRGMKAEDVAKYGTGWRDPAVVEAGIEGTGRGSGSVRARITELGGKLISIETELKKGTKVLFSVPLDAFVKEVNGVEFTVQDELGYRFRAEAPDDLIAQARGEKPVDDLLVITYPWRPEAQEPIGQQLIDRYIEGIQAAEKIGVPSVVLVDDWWNGEQLRPYTTALVESDKMGDIKPKVQTKRAVFAGGSLWGAINRSIHLFASSEFDRTKKTDKIFTARLVPDTIWVYEDQFSDYYQVNVGVGKTLKQVIEEAGNDPKEVVKIVKSLVNHPDVISLDQTPDIKWGAEDGKVHIVLSYQDEEYVIRKGDTSRVLKIEILDDFPFGLTSRIQARQFSKALDSPTLPSSHSPTLPLSSSLPLPVTDEWPSIDDTGRREAIEKSLIEGLTWDQYEALTGEEKERFAREFKHEYDLRTYEGGDEDKDHPLRNDDSVAHLLKTARDLAVSYPDSLVYSFGNSAQWFVYSASLLDPKSDRFGYIPSLPRGGEDFPIRWYLDLIGLNPRTIANRDTPIVIAGTQEDDLYLLEFIVGKLLPWAKEEGVLKEVVEKLTLHFFVDDEDELSSALREAMERDGLTFETSLPLNGLAQTLLQSSNILEAKLPGGDRLAPNSSDISESGVVSPKKFTVSRTAALGRFRVMDYMGTHGVETVKDRKKRAFLEGLSWRQYRALPDAEKEELRAEFKKAYKRGGAPGEFEAHSLTDDDSVDSVVKVARYIAEFYPDSRIYSLGNSAQWFVYAASLIDQNPDRFSYIPYFQRYEAEKPDREKFRRYLESIGLDPKSIVARGTPTVIVETPISGNSLTSFLLEELLSWAGEEGVLKQVLYKLTLHVFSDEETELPLAVRAAERDGMTRERRSSQRELAGALTRSSGILELKSRRGDRLVPSLESLIQGDTTVSRTAALGRFRIMDYLAERGMTPDSRPRGTPPIPIRDPAAEDQVSGPRGKGTPPVPRRDPTAPLPVVPVGKPKEDRFLSFDPDETSAEELRIRIAAGDIDIGGRRVTRSLRHQVTRRPSLVAPATTTLAGKRRSPALRSLGGGGSLVVRSLPKQSLSQVYFRLIRAGKIELMNELQERTGEISAEQRTRLVRAGRNGIALVDEAERILAELSSKSSSPPVTPPLQHRRAGKSPSHALRAAERTRMLEAARLLAK